MRYIFLLFAFSSCVTITKNYHCHPKEEKQSALKVDSIPANLWRQPVNLPGISTYPIKIDLWRSHDLTIDTTLNTRDTMVIKRLFE